MDIKARDGRTYEVRSKGATFEVWLEGAQIGSFVLADDDITVTVSRAGEGKTKGSIFRELAEEFVERGGSPMRIM